MTSSSLLLQGVGGYGWIFSLSFFLFVMISHIHKYLPSLITRLPLFVVDGGLSPLPSVFSVHCGLHQMLV
jgi:hypothetical protein